MGLDDKDKAILNILQDDFPIVAEPFAALAKKLGLDKTDVLVRVKQLTENGSLKRIHAVINRRKLGIRRESTLIGMNVPEDRLDEVAQIVNTFSGLTHNCARTHPRYNLWYVIEAENNESLKQTNAEIVKATGISDTVDLPGLKLYKINVKYRLGEN